MAVHSARNDIHAGFADGAVGGGINLIICPDVITTLSVASMLSDTRCKVLDSSADGYVRGESAVLVLLSQESMGSEPSSDCVGLLWGSSVNQDGRSSSLTAPNGPSQSDVILAAWRSSSRSASEMDVVQMHGTGTALGKESLPQASVAANDASAAGTDSTRTSVVTCGGLLICR